MPPVFYWQAKNRRLRRPCRQVPSQVRDLRLAPTGLRFLGRILLACLVAASLAGSPAWAKKNKPPSAEEIAGYGDAALGKLYHERIIEAFGVYEDKALGAYVQQLGEELAAHAPGDDYSWRFTVLDMDLVNAFALPGGYIYVTRGLLAHLNSEAQLAAVLGHEIGHVSARHAARQQTAARVVGKVTGTMAAASGGFNLGTLFGAGLVRGYGREMELEADQTGATLLAAAGYDPAAGLQVLQVLKAYEQYQSGSNSDDGELSVYHAMLSSHPEKDRRTRELIANASKDLVASRTDGAASYLQKIDGLAFEGSTHHGVLRDNVLYHYELNLAITFPADWKVANLPDRLVAQPPAGDATMVVNVFPQKAKRMRKVKVNEFLQKRLGVRRWQNSRHEEIHGNPAFITSVPKARTPYGLRLARLGVIYHGDNAYVFSGAAENEERQRKYDREFVQIIESMRPIGADEAAMAQPVRVKIIRMPPDITVAQLADQSSYADEKLLRLLNALGPDQEPLPGQQVKFID